MLTADRVIQAQGSRDTQWSHVITLLHYLLINKIHTSETAPSFAPTTDDRRSYGILKSSLQATSVSDYHLLLFWAFYADFQLKNYDFAHIF